MLRARPKREGASVPAKSSLPSMAVGLCTLILLTLMEDARKEERRRGRALKMRLRLQSGVQWISVQGEMAIAMTPLFQLGKSSYHV